MIFFSVSLVISNSFCHFHAVSGKLEGNLRMCFNLTFLIIIFPSHMAKQMLINLGWTIECASGGDRHLILVRLAPLLELSSVVVE